MRAKGWKSSKDIGSPAYKCAQFAANLTLGTSMVPRVIQKYSIFEVVPYEYHQICKYAGAFQSFISFHTASNS